MGTKGRREGGREGGREQILIITHHPDRADERKRAREMLYGSEAAASPRQRVDSEGESSWGDEDEEHNKIAIQSGTSREATGVELRPKESSESAMQSNQGENSGTDGNSSAPSSEGQRSLEPSGPSGEGSFLPSIGEDQEYEDED